MEPGYDPGEDPAIRRLLRTIHHLLRRLSEDEVEGDHCFNDDISSTWVQLELLLNHLETTMSGYEKYHFWDKEPGELSPRHASGSGRKLYRRGYQKQRRERSHARIRAELDSIRKEMQDIRSRPRPEAAFEADPGELSPGGSRSRKLGFARSVIMSPGRSLVRQSDNSAAKETIVSPRTQACSPYRSEVPSPSRVSHASAIYGPAETTVPIVVGQPVPTPVSPMRHVLAPSRLPTHTSYITSSVDMSPAGYSHVPVSAAQPYPVDGNVEHRLRELEMLTSQLQRENESLKNKHILRDQSSRTPVAPPPNQDAKESDSSRSAKHEEKERTVPLDASHIQTLEEEIANLRARNRTFTELNAVLTKRLHDIESHVDSSKLKRVGGSSDIKRLKAKLQASTHAYRSGRRTPAEMMTMRTLKMLREDVSSVKTEVASFWTNVEPMLNESILVALKDASEREKKAIADLRRIVEKHARAEAVSHAPHPKHAEGDILSIPIGEAMKTVTRGSRLTKHHHGNSKPATRMFWITRDCRIIQWNTAKAPPRKKKGSEVNGSGSTLHVGSATSVTESPKDVPAKDPKKRFLRLADVKEIRLGQKTPVFERWSAQAGGVGGGGGTTVDALSFSLVTGTRSLDIVCHNKIEFSTWVTGLRAAVQRAKADRDPHWETIKAAWQAADKDGSGTLSVSEVVGLLKAFNFPVSKKYAVEIVQRFDVDSSGALDYNEFVSFLNNLTHRPNMESVFQRYAQNDTVLSVEEFRTFLREEQREDVTDEQAASILKTFGKKSGVGQSDADDTLGVNGFMLYLASMDNTAYHPSALEKPYQDMTRPLHEYFVATSHNTYLLGDQLRSRSSVEGYIRAFEKGCRCVELDCWNGPDGEPIILHGGTLTSSITFRSVIRCCREYGFRFSDYPLLLSLEMHCDLNQQDRIAGILKDELGDMLYTLPSNFQEHPHMPSPLELKHKILVKGKVLSGAGAASDEDDDDDDESWSHMVDVQQTHTPKGPPNPNSSSPSKSLSTPKQKSGTAAGGHKPKVSKDLSDITSLRAFTFRNLSVSESLESVYAMHSFSELKAAKLMKSQPQRLTQHLQRHIARLYPKGTRVDSSNYEPEGFWAAGFQLVALNYQTGDKPMQVYRGMFRNNGGCGYILKPPHLRHSREPLPKPAGASVAEDSVSTMGGLQMLEGPIKARIRIISAHQLPRPGVVPDGVTTAFTSEGGGEIIDPYVVVELLGTKEDKKVWKTKTVNNNGFNPEFHEVFEQQVSNPTTALLYIAVYDEDVGRDDFVASAAIPFSCLRQGYRCIHLHTAEGDPISDSCSVFAHIELTPV